MNIYVGNLPLEMTEDELRKEFMAFGAVASVVIMNDRYIGSGQAKAYGFVQMNSNSEGKSAIDGLTGKNLKNRAIYVVEALPLSFKKDVMPFHVRLNNQFNRKVRQRY